MFSFLNILVCLICFLSLVFLFIYLFMTVICYTYWKRRGVPYLRPRFPYGNIQNMLMQEISMNMCMWNIYKETKHPYIGIYLFHKPALLIRDPDLIKRILIKDFNVFQDRGMYCDEEKEPLSGHLFRLTGQRWRYMRSKLSPSFTLGKLKVMFETMVKTAKQLENYLTEISGKGESVIIKDCTVRYSADIIASVIFGIEVNSFVDRNNKWWTIVTSLLSRVEFIRHIIFSLVMFAPGIMNMLRIPSLYHISNRQIFELVKEVVEYRENNKVTRNDFMQLLIQLKNQGEVNADDNIKNTDVYNKDSSKEGLSIYEVSAQAYTMFFAGFDTSGSTISWALYLLAKHPDVQAKVHEEIDKCLHQHGGELTYDALQEMAYLDYVICETLRLYPVLGFTNRVATVDYKIPDSNVIIKKGTSVYVSLLGLHHDPAYFPDPEQFNPERFSAENKQHIQNCTYMPFGEGPRNCIGKRFGQLQTGVGLVMVLRKHRVTLAKDMGEDIAIDPKQFSHAPLIPFRLYVNQRVQ